MLTHKKYSIPPVIKNVIADTINIGQLNSFQRFQLMKAITGYVLGVFFFDRKSAQCQEHMVSCTKDFINRKQLSDIRVASIQNFDMIVRFKQVIYYLLSNHIYKRSKVIAKFIEYGLTSLDAKLFFDLEDFDLYEPCLDKLKEAQSSFLDPDRVRQKCARLMKYFDRTGFIIKYTKRKFPFIINHNNMEIEDIVQPLRIAAMSAFYLTIPFKSHLHVRNIAMRAMHNAGMNIIERYTSKKRSRLTKDGVTQVSMSIRNLEGEDFDQDFSDSERVEDNEDKMILRISISALLKKYKGKKHKVIQVLMMKNYNSFLNFVLEQENRTFSSVEEFRKFCKTNSYYLETIRAWVGVTPAQFYKFIDEIKTQLDVAHL